MPYRMNVVKITKEILANIETPEVKYIEDYLLRNEDVPEVVKNLKAALIPVADISELPVADNNNEKATVLRKIIHRNNFGSLFFSYGASGNI